MPASIITTTPPANGTVEASLGRRLRTARDAAGLTVDEAARRLGVLKATWQDWEDDRNEPRANRLAMVAGVLAVSPSWLLSGIGDGPWERQADDSAALLRELRQASQDMATLNRRMREITLGLERLQ